MCICCTFSYRILAPTLYNISVQVEQDSIQTMDDDDEQILSNDADENYEEESLTMEDNNAGLASNDVLRQRLKPAEADIEEETYMDEFEALELSYKGEDEENAVLKLLKTMMESDLISEVKYEEYVSEFKNLDRTLIEIMSKEAAYMNKGKSLKRELLECKKKFRQIEKSSGQTQQYLADLRRDLMKSENQLAITHESESQLQTTVIETERNADFLENERAKLIAKRMEKEKPIIDKLTKEIDDLSGQIEQIEATMSKEEDKRSHNMDQIKRYEEQLAQDEEQIKKITNELQSKEDEPKLAQNQVEIVRQAIAAAETDIEIKNERLFQLEETVKQLEAKLEDIEVRKSNTSNQNYNLNVTLEQIEEEIVNAKQNIMKMKDANTIAVSKKFSISHEEITKKEELKIETDSLKVLQKVEEDMVKKAFKIESQIKALEREIAKQEKVKEMLLTEKRRVEEKLSKMKAEKMVLDREVDILSNDLITNEYREDTLFKELTTKDREVKDLEQSITKTADEERHLAKEIMDLENEREKKAREAAKQKYMLVETRGEIKILTFVNSELQKKLQVIENEIVSVNELYSQMRQERNKCAKAIQDNAQMLAMIREKNKILENELEVLKAQINKKNVKLNAALAELEKKNKLSRKLLTESSKLKMIIEEKEKRKQELQSEIDELNMNIDLTEESMIVLKNRYESGVQDRNYTGIQLIDRNDELCILYEKANIQENIIKEGEIELQKREQELKMLSLELDNLRRETQLVFKRVPEYEASKKEKDALEKQIDETHRQADELSSKLEDPENTERWRELKGNIPSKEELKDKVQELEEKLNQRSEQLMEKNLMLQEITQSSDESRMEAMQGRDAMYDLAVNTSKVQARIREVNRKMMATLSELSVYQATAMELEQSNKELEDMIKSAEERLENGEAPSQEHEEHWIKEERLKYKRQLEMQARQERLNLIQSLPATVTRSTANQRYTAYIPDDELGLPKPYFFQPMQYAENGSTMRHIRKPQKRDIEL
jgi:chromosome segregation ATPase